MLLTDEQVNARLESPLNLVNRLNRLTEKRSTGMELFIPSSSNCQPTNLAGVENDDELDNILPDNVEKIKLGLVKSKALDVLHDSLNTLHLRLPEVQRVKDLSNIAAEMNRIVTVEDSSKSKSHQQVIVYRPIINEISKYDTLVVNE